MLRLERLPVHLIDEQHLGTPCLGDREAPLVVVLDPALHAAIPTSEHELERLVPKAGLVEEWRERRSGPLRRADRLEQPRVAQGSRLQSRPAVAGALERHGQRPPGPASELVERDLQGPIDEPVEPQPPARRIDGRDVEVDEQVVQPGRRDVVPQRLERHAPVAARELQLLEGQGAIGRWVRRRRPGRHSLLRARRHLDPILRGGRPVAESRHSPDMGRRSIRRGTRNVDSTTIRG